MFRMLMNSFWGTGPMLRPSNHQDPTLEAKLYTWSNEEFRQQFSLIYTSRYDPSQTCASYCRVSHNKALFTLYDWLCEGNSVRIDIELSTQREHNGLIVIRDARVKESKGSFVVRTAAPGLSLLKYQDKFGCRTGTLWLLRITRDVQEIRFVTGFPGGFVLSYFFRVICDPWKGLDVVLAGPNCVLNSFISRPLGLCNVDHIQGMPPHDVVKQVTVVAEVREVERRDGSDDGAHLLALTQNNNNNNAILNAGQAQGNFNGANFKDCHFSIDLQSLHLKGLSNST